MPLGGFIYLHCMMVYIAWLMAGRRGLRRDFEYQITRLEGQIGDLKSHVEDLENQINFS